MPCASDGGDLLQCLLEFQVLGHNSITLRTPPRLTLARFLSTSHGIEADLRALALECRRRAPSVKVLAERACLRVGDYSERREFAFRSSKSGGFWDTHTRTPVEGDAGTLTQTGATPSFPTWDILAVLWGVTHEIATAGEAVHLQKSLLLGLSSLQRLLGLWQMQQQCQRSRLRTSQSEEDTRGSPFDQDVFLTGEQLDVIFGFFTENALSAAAKPPPPGTRASQNGTLATATLEAESIQVKVLQTLLALFSIDTPLFAPDALVERPVREGESRPSEGVLPAAAQFRAFRILELLVKLHRASSFPAVQRTAVAGLSQFARYLLDSCTVVIAAAAADARTGESVAMDPRGAR